LLVTAKECTEFSSNVCRLLVSQAKVSLEEVKAGGKEIWILCLKSAVEGELNCGFKKC
jgi:hypothetical protein